MISLSKGTILATFLSNIYGFWNFFQRKNNSPFISYYSIKIIDIKSLSLCVRKMNVKYLVLIFDKDFYC